MDISTLTDGELVAAANEYIQRAMRKMRRAGLRDRNYIWLIALSDTYKPEEYKISHQMDYGNYGKEVKLKGGNLFELVAKHLVIEGVEVTPPLQVTPMLPAPTPPESPEYTAFTEVDEPSPGPQHSAELDDDVPF